MTRCLWTPEEGRLKQLSCLIFHPLFIVKMALIGGVIMKSYGLIPLKTFRNFGLTFGIGMV